MPQVGEFTVGRKLGVPVPLFLLAPLFCTLFHEGDRVFSCPTQEYLKSENPSLCFLHSDQAGPDGQLFVPYGVSSEAEVLRIAASWACMAGRRLYMSKCISYLFHCYDKIHDKTHEEEERLYWLRVYRIQVHHGGENRKWEAAGHIGSVVRKQRE